MTEKPSVTIILGPTASGKTDAAIQRATQLGGSVVSADSRQIYVDMDIGTAKPSEIWKTPQHDVATPQIIEAIPHYLFNICTLDTSFSLSEWQSAAYERIDHIIQSGNQPIICGGTMLYIDSILFDYTIPDVEPNQKLRQQLEEQSTETLADTLRQKDPNAFKFVEPHNRRRIIRALEVIEATGKPFSLLRQKHDPKYTFTVIGLFPGWDELRSRITQRVDFMLEGGLVEETKQLQKIYGSDHLLLQTINYREASQLLDGTADKEKARDAMIRANMQYARRQMRWWQGRSDISWNSPA